jgi:outer membrane protein assembly factor BamA
MPKPLIIVLPMLAALVGCGSLKVPAAGPEQVDAVSTVTEGRVVDLNLSGGVTSDDGILSLISLSMRNFEADSTLEGGQDGPPQLYRKEAFQGDGETFLLDLSPGSKVRYYRMFYSHPDIWK